MAKFLWTQKQDIGPKPRRGHAMAYDIRRKSTVLFGGDSITHGLFKDTWEWDGENWTQITDIGPDPRCFFGMAYDASRSRTVLFGGRGANNFNLLGDTWEWDGGNWTQVEDDGPSPRSSHALSYHPQRKRIVLFGGVTGDGIVADTWEWDGEQWTQIGEVGPPARVDHMLAYDTRRNQLMMFGGSDGPAAFNDTWGWDGENWAQVADIGPDPCHHAALVTTGKRLVLFGGIALSGPDGAVRIDGGTWEWVNKRWVQRSNFGPAARWGHAMAYDESRKQLVLFGGLPVKETEPGEELTALLLGDTWEHSVTPEADGEGAAGSIEEFTLTPNTAVFEEIAAGNPFRVDGRIVLGNLHAETLQAIIVGEIGNPLPVQIPAGILEYHASIIIPPAAVGTYTFRAKLDDSEKAATFTIT